MLRRFWFTFDLRTEVSPPPGTALGCGVTAASMHDAMRMLEEVVFEGRTPVVVNVVADVDVSTLDAGHVLPNMGNPVVAGVWFPLGYSRPYR